MDLKWISVIVLFSAVCGVSAYVPHQYHVVNEGKTWTEAQSYCRQNYTDLATINNMEDINTIPNDKLLEAWIGLEKVKWQWSLQEEMFYRELDYSNWKSGEPRDTKEICVQMEADGKWNVKNCVEKLPFMCYEGKNAHRYILIKDKKNWRDAQSFCRERYTDLARVRNQTENKEIKNAAKGKTVWIGLFRVSWKWSDQSYSSFRYWKKNQPDNFGGNESCVEMLKSGQWNDVNCETKLPFICYKVKKCTYILINGARTWSGAQSYCRKYHTDLASVRNQTENQKIWDLIQNVSSKRVWIGLFYDSWRWPDQSDSSFRYWASRQPDHFGGNEDCAAVSMTDQRHWSDVNCKNKLPFICYKNKLILIKQNLTWREALGYCRVNHVDLVSVQSEEIQLWVKDVAQKASIDHVWLGLRHTCTLSFWYWVSGESICYQNWAPGNGTGGEDCSSVERTGAVQARGGQQWVSLPEDHKLNFICTTYED
ncbi:macrophage mannose receptor 1-like [Colossoma macropomum]|uniref:macrophage mannose receptor 1-like n=1 Tax=Colossoma macropomum TaxID=42526 RepID=UPI001863C74D|nr:macrophage mannose receptor 1-like [Colossoma macropomum]